MITISNLLTKLFIIILVIVFVTSFSASYNSLNIDNLAFVIALGIDKSDTNELEVTFEFSAVDPSSEGTLSTKPVFNTVQCSSITNGINMMNAYLDRKVNLSHCKLIVFSEEIAKDGIADEIYSLINETQVRPSSNIVVSKCNSKYYIENSTPTLESLVTKYYQIFPNTSEYTGYTCNATIGDFFNNISSNYSDPYAILGGINNSDNSSNSETVNDSTIKSNETPITGTRKTQNIGLAVFDNDKLVGELNAIETACFLNIEKKIDTFLISIPNPEIVDNKIDIYLTPNTTHKIDVSIVNGAPYVKIKLRFSGKIYSMTRDAQYLDNKILDKISNSCNTYLESQFSNYLYKTSNVFKSDINQFGSYALSEFTTTSEFENYDWQNNYKNSTFDIDIETIIDSGFLLNQT
ncbi:MAG: hypothetical protein HFJ59_04300 [Clostridia bacterium]|nr:hypothetical protein [Clostridia bacterium]